MSDENVLTKEIAEQFLADEDSVDLSEFTAIAGEAAESLSSYKGVGFYSFRHMTETIASEAEVKNVQPVIDLIMGHDDGTMASNYRESISDKRIKAVCQHLRGWLFDE